MLVKELFHGDSEASIMPSEGSSTTLPPPELLELLLEEEFEESLDIGGVVLSLGTDDVSVQLDNPKIDDNATILNIVIFFFINRFASYMPLIQKLTPTIDRLKSVLINRIFVIITTSRMRLMKLY